MNAYFLCLVLSCWLATSHSASLPANETKRIIGGQTVNIEDYSYYVYLRMSFPQGYYAECGGSLVRVDRVITAAHCVLDTTANSISVYAGLQGRAQIATTTPYKARSVHIHWSFIESRLPLYDIAVIKLASNVQTGTRVNPIAIAWFSPPLRSRVTVVGYGNTVCNNDGTGKCRYAASNQLQKTDLTVTAYDGHVMITKGETSATCNGDSGGPFVYNSKLVGVVSAGGTLCTGNNYEVSVSHITIVPFLKLHIIL